MNYAVDQIRDLSQILSPLRGDSGSLSSALRQLASTTASVFDVDCTADVLYEPVFKDETSATHLFRIAQEAVTNAIRHGRAHTIQIALRRENGCCILAVTDDGAGFIMKPSHQGMGLRTMDYRARMLGGSVSVGPGPECGIAVVCTLPIDE